MFFGVHLLLHSRDPEADRAFFRDVLEIPAIDAGEGWLVFTLPPAEMGIHPAAATSAATDGGQSLANGTVYLMCENLAHTIDRLAAKGGAHAPVREGGWGGAPQRGPAGSGKPGLLRATSPVGHRAASRLSEQAAPRPSRRKARRS